MGCKHSTPVVVVPTTSTSSTASDPSTSTATPVSSPTAAATSTDNNVSNEESTASSSATGTTSSPDNEAKPQPVVPTHPTSRTDLRYIRMKNGLPSLRIRQTITNEDKIFEISDQLIGKGKEGEIYKAIVRTKYIPESTEYSEKEFIACKIIPRTLFPSDEIFKDFIKINQTASTHRFGPKVYGIVDYEDENVYLFTEMLSGDLKKWIKLQVLVPDDDNLGISSMVPVNFNMLLPDIQNIVAPIHEKMYEHAITLGDDHMDNYMYCSNSGWFRIDFTQCRFHSSKDIDEEDELAKYQVFKVINPFTQETKKLYQLCKRL